MSTDSVPNLFPSDPTHGMIFEQRSGVLYQYDSTLNSWVKIASDNAKLPIATASTNGAMSASDYNKLNNLVVPPPYSSIVGNNCVAPYQRGVINLYSGDKFVSVNGTLGLQNIDEFGDLIKEDFAYKIHQHTYGFDFRLDIKELVSELERRGQLTLVGRTGPKGDKGEVGDPGVSGILSGPKGDKGAQGTAPTTEITVEPESFEVGVASGTARAITNARVVVDPVDNRKYYLEFDRQVVGNPFASASQFIIRQINSTWLLAIAALNESDSTTLSWQQCATPQSADQLYPIYCIDIEPILTVIEDKYQSEMERLKKGYEDIIAFWIRTMSDMFDEQKLSLGAALEKCISITKNTELRQHMESTAATVAGKAKMLLHGRHDPGSVQISGTRVFQEIGYPDNCKEGPKFPLNPYEQIRADANSTTPTPGLLAKQNMLVITIDPILNSSLASSYTFDLPQGSYVATILQTDAQVNGVYKNNIRIRHNNGGEFRTAQFMDRGSFDSLSETQQNYEGLSISFAHDGGNVNVYLPSIQTTNASGSIKISIESSKKQALVQNPISTVTRSYSNLEGFTCLMPKSKLNWYKSGYENGKCCSAIISLSGQQYIVVRKSLGTDKTCGGGETKNTQCLAELPEHPSFAWPTLDGQTFMAVEDDVVFMYSSELNKIAGEQLDNRFGMVLFPSA